MNKDKYTEVFEIIDTLGLSRTKSAEVMGINYQSFKDKSNPNSRKFFNQKNLNDLIEQTKINIKKLNL